MNILLTKLGKFLLDVLLSKAAQEVYEEVALHLLDKGVKSTETDWDNKMADVIKEKINAKSK